MATIVRAVECDFPVFGYAASGAGAEGLVRDRVVSLLPVGSGARGGGRLPRVAYQLAQRASKGHTLRGGTGVVFGTAFGCLTETESFVSHMIREREATPKPRAFSSSVHNAIASFVALKLNARGECQTFVHGELSFAQALFAAVLAHRRSGESYWVGALDELPAHTFRALEQGVRGTSAAHEGGAVLFGGGSEDVSEAVAGSRLVRIELGRTQDVPAWFAGSDAKPELVLHAGPPAPEADFGSEPGCPVFHAPPDHPSSLATRTALALSILDGESSATLVGLSTRPSRLAVLGTTADGDAALFELRGFGA